MLSVRTSTTAAMFLLCALASGSGLPNSWFADEQVYTFAYNSRSLLAHSNLTTDAQVRMNVLRRWYKYFGCDCCFPTACIYIGWLHSKAVVLWCCLKADGQFCFIHVAAVGMMDAIEHPVGLIVTSTILRLSTSPLHGPVLSFHALRFPSKLYQMPRQQTNRNSF